MPGEELNVTLIDVGSGDSILIEATNSSGDTEFALVDCNDTTNCQSSRTFLKRHFERRKLTPLTFPFFEFVLTTHAHADHTSGIQRLLRAFGATNLYSSHCNPANNVAFANMIRWAQKATKKGARVVTNMPEYLWRQKKSLNLGPARIDLLWPPDNAASAWDPNNENNNSLVLAITLDEVTFVLTGDCEADNWRSKHGDFVQLPKKKVRMVQIPHHSARNGCFDANDDNPLLDAIANINKSKVAASVAAALSCHPRPYNHPHSDVTSELDLRNIEHYRTDECYHVTFHTDGRDVFVRRSRF